MALSDISREGIFAALNEYDLKGRDAFLNEYGFGPARKYMLVYGNHRYDSKAICGVAHKFDQPLLGALRHDDFKGGLKTVVLKLQNLGFSVLDELSKFEIKNNEGIGIKATCDVSHEKNGWAVTLHSRGGTKGTASERNPGYREGLETLLSRLGENRALITEVLLDSDRSHKLQLEKRRLLAAVPSQLEPTTNFIAIAREISKTSAAIRSEATTKPGGNSTKQIRITFTMDSATSLSQVESLLVNGKKMDRPVFVLGWSPAEDGLENEEIAERVSLTRSGKSISEKCLTGDIDSGINPDDYVVCLTQMEDPGIIALGRAISHVDKETDLASAGKTKNYVGVAWEQALPIRDRLTIEQIENLTHTAQWDAKLEATMKLSEADSRKVVTAWALWYYKMTGTELNLSGEEAGAISSFPLGVSEGALTTVVVNRYERSAVARRQCIDYYGAKCLVCGLDFQEYYGEIGEGFIHVHHVVPIASIGETYILDPIADLVPVCPNCHAMLHRGVEVPRSIEDLRNFMNTM